MHVELQLQPFEKLDADMGIELITKETLETHSHKPTLERAGFKAEQDQICTLFEHNLIVCGIDSTHNDDVRSACVSLVKTLSQFNIQSAKIAVFNLESIRAVVEGFVLGGYRFETYKSEPKPVSFKRLFIASDTPEGESLDTEQVKAHLQKALLIAEATNFTRDLVNTTPEDMTPKAMGIVAKDLADSHKLECTILDENAIAEEGMNAILGVGRASTNPPRLIHLAYRPKHPKACITLVGKGLTYDSGGLSLKPAASMVTMKMDKAGACAVLGMLKAVSDLELPIEVHGFIGAAENMVAGNAYKPDDVLKTRSGKTIEVRNTDAEGRLVLSDVLCYAQEEVKADYLFDFATLTGACMVALGQYTTGLMGHNDALKQSIAQAAERSGELVGTLPFNKHLKKLLKSEIADISNTASKPYGGAITAGLFLDHFIEEEMKEKWVHFDIAGSAYTESAWDCNPVGGTGAAVRMGVEFIASLDV